MLPLPENLYRFLFMIPFSILLFSAAFGQARGGKIWMYVGTYTGKGSDGIYLYQFDPATGKLQYQGLAARSQNPSFIAIDPPGRFLYAVNEISTFNKQPTGAISVFSIEPKSGKLKFLQQVSSLGSGPAHLSLDQTGRYLLVANYGGGNVAVFPIRSNGQLGERTAFMQAKGSSVNKARQEASHAHCIHTTADNRLALVADLGTDKLMVYGFDGQTGTLRLDSSKIQSLAPGAGPRHIAMVPWGRHLYVANELSSSVTHFAYDASGKMEMRETVPTLSADFSGENTAAGIVVDPRGKSLYVSNRGEDSIVLFDVNSTDGSLTLVGRTASGGRTPRAIALDPTGKWLFCANQNSNAITLFRVNPDDGRLTRAEQSKKVVSPVCVTFAARP